MNKKIVLAVFLGLVASAAALIASLFMLSEMQKNANVPTQIKELANKFNNLDTNINQTDIANKVKTEISAEIQAIVTDVDDLKESQKQVLDSLAKGTTTTTKPNTEKPATNTQTPTTPQTTEKPSTNTTTPTTDKNASSTNRLNLRSNPGLKSPVVRTMSSGEKVTVLGEEKTADGYTWMKVKDSKGTIGWVAKKYTN